MNGYLKQYPAILQFVTIIGFFVGFLALSLLLITLLSPYLTGYTALEVQTKVLTDHSLIGSQRLIQTIYTCTAFFVPSAIFCYLWQPEPATYLGLKTRNSFMQILLVIVLYFCVMPFANVLGEWNHTWNLPASAFDIQRRNEELIKAMLYMPKINDLVLNLLCMAVVPAIAEELLFRGVIQRVMINMTRQRWLSVVFTGIIFSAVHGEMLDFLMIALLGMVLGAVYVLTNNLWLAILIHAVNNGSMVVYSYLYQHGKSTTDPMKDSHMPWYLGLASLVVTVGLFAALSRRSPNQIQVETVTDDEEDQEN
ncbi:CPBP family intramembrane glutamic endopeptidase [Chitinophaga sp. Cy-1792]|uniref:CPBP family intramembrane glutamic endopeptidase n=1 Tax=Chitinophaga sp. Cy-1792 TaxID=2608339 RepID=UPI00141D8F21|nr:CPBP family intramembrane glutamic endopeptidase [Chitinophaga sp. Cy-1792]NIG52489.1 CPBP family intramembrane metalloprotease [Chitinophaga sp. Cy-1792]